MSEIKSKLPETTYIELVRSLLATVWPAVTMSACFVAVGGLVLWQAPDARIAALVSLGAIAAAARIGVVLIFREQVAKKPLTAGMAKKLEGFFALTYLSFAAVLGVFCAAAIVIGPAALNAIIVALIFGYGAGVAAGLSLRPSITVPGVVVAAAPTIIVMLRWPDAAHQMLGVMTAIFVIGGGHSMVTRYRATAADITMRRSFSALARRDYLTGLPNRLSLRERVEEFARGTGGVDIVAVHCLDLDRFKPVNDNFGHPVGDALLTAVADRLLGVVRKCDFAARVGGDEFVIIQTQASDPDDAKRLARRIVETIAQPFVIDGHVIQIATSVGYVLAPTRGSDISCLIGWADRALCNVKRQGGGIERYDPDQSVAGVRHRAPDEVR